MNYSALRSSLLACTIVTTSAAAWAGQAPGAASSPDIPISHRDRVYAAEQFSNTVSVTDPVDNKLLGDRRVRQAMLLARVGRALMPPETRDGRTFFGCDLGPAEMTARDVLAIANAGHAAGRGASCCFRTCMRRR